MARTSSLATILGTATCAAMMAAPAQAAAPGPNIDIDFQYSTSGYSVTYSYDFSGTQHYAVAANGARVALSRPAKSRIQFGDGTETSKDGLGTASCTGKGLAPFSDYITVGEHKYSKPGTYTITVSPEYCGGPGRTPVRVVRTFKVIVPNTRPSEPTTVPPRRAGAGIQKLNYSVSGRTVTFAPRVSGYQHDVIDTTTGQQRALNKPMSISVSYGDGKGVAHKTPSASCSRDNFNRLDYTGGPWTHTYAKPGRYKVTVNTTFCGDQFNSDTRTYDVIVPAKGHAPATSTKGAPANGPRATTKAPHTSAHGPRTSTAPTSAPKAGPKVQTDKVDGSGGSGAPGLMVLGGAVAAAGAVGVTRVARRRH